MTKALRESVVEIDRIKIRSQYLILSNRDTEIVSDFINKSHIIDLPDYGVSIQGGEFEEELEKLDKITQILFKNLFQYSENKPLNIGIDYSNGFTQPEHLEKIFFDEAYIDKVDEKPFIYIKLPRK